MARNSYFQVKIRHFSKNVAIRLRNAARRAARQRRTNQAAAEEGEDITGVNLGARRLRVPVAVSKPRCHLSREATGPYIARTASTPRREAAAAAAGEIAGTAVVIECRGFSAFRERRFQIRGWRISGQRHLIKSFEYFQIAAPGGHRLQHFMEMNHCSLSVFALNELCSPLQLS